MKEKKKNTETEEKLISIICDICKDYDDEFDEDIKASERIDKYLDEITLDDLSVAIEEEYHIILDPEDMDGKKISQIADMIEDEI